MQAAVAIISVSRSIYNKLSFHCHVIYISKIKVFVFVHIHISHTPPTPLIPRTTLIHSTSAALHTIPEPRVPSTCPTFTTPHPSPTPALPSLSHPHTLSAYTYATQTTVHVSQSHKPPHPHRVPRQTKGGHITTDTTQ